MRKLKMSKQQLNNLEASQKAKGVSEATLNNYKYNLKNTVINKGRKFNPI